VKNLRVAALSLALSVGLPGRAQVVANPPVSTDPGRIQNIAPEEMWKRVTQCVFPAYPLPAYQSLITGTVDIGLGISPKGEVANHRVLSGHPLLIPAAVDAIRQWKFQPNMVEGEATWSRVRALARFNADGTTTVDLARAFRADDFGDPDTPMTDPAVAMASTTAAVPRPTAALVCQSAQPLTHPRAIYAPDPEYSNAARKAHLQGVVKLSIVVAADGTVHDVKVVRPLGKGLDEKAIEALRHWKFIPAMKNGQPVDVQLIVEVNFRIR